MTEQKQTARGKESGPAIEPTDLNRPTRFQTDTRFRVDIPQVECPLKSLVTSFEPEELSKFRLTQEERIPKWETTLPQFLGFRFDETTAEAYTYELSPASPDQAELSDPETLDSMPSLDNEDFEILDAVESVIPEKMEINPETLMVQVKTKKSTLMNEKEARWWLKETTKGVTQSQFDAFTRKQQMKLKKRKFRTFSTQNAFNEFVKKGFEKQPPEQHNVYTKPASWMSVQTPQLTKTKKAVATYDLVPEEDEKGRAYCTVHFHNNCIEDSERLLPHEKFSTQISENVLLKELYVEPKDRQEAEVNRAIAFDNKYLGLIVPCKVNTSKDRRESFINKEADYLWIREYFYRKIEDEKELGKWRWALRLDREKKIAQLVPIRKRFLTQKQKLRSVVHRPVSVKVKNKIENNDPDGAQDD